MRIRPVGAELLRADGRTDGETDINRLIDVLSNFVKEHKTQSAN